MDTVYYNLKARRIKVSGGEELVTFIPAPISKPAGEVLDFARCRQKLERKAAWKSLTEAAREEEAESRWAHGRDTASIPVQSAREIRHSRGVERLELVATLAVALVSLSAALAFFSLV